MIFRRGLGVGVLAAAHDRLLKIGASGRTMVLSFSGGKDSLVLSNLVYREVIAGNIDPAKLRVAFVDEEAIYPCVERIVLKEREKWMSTGVRFDWYCMEFKHFNCLNALQNDETFITWDRRKKDVWVREMPKFAITNSSIYDPMNGYNTYQDYFAKEQAKTGELNLIGLRAAESYQRARSIAGIRDMNWKVYPIYDWTDNDVWKYLKDNDIEIPEAYLHLYSVGVSKNMLRISQFFSIDTARSLSQMSKFYPDLWERIIRREPNADLVLLYFETEMFRRAHGQQKKALIEDMASRGETFKSKVIENMKGMKERGLGKEHKSLTSIFFKESAFLSTLDPNSKIYKSMYEVSVAGDPKLRTVRAINADLQTLKFAALTKEAGVNE